MEALYDVRLRVETPHKEPPYLARQAENSEYAGRDDRRPAATLPRADMVQCEARAEAQ